MIEKLQPLYNMARPYLTTHELFTTWQILHSVPVRNACIFDYQLVNKNYKPGLASLVTEHVKSSDIVVEIGGGRGVMTVLAAREGADVITFEPAREMRELLHQTIMASMVEERVTVREEIVGSMSDITRVREDGYGEPSTEIVAPSELPECDVLMMDCEGAEDVVINEMSIRPDRVIYESHPDRANPKALNTTLRDRGYMVVENRQVQSDTCRQVYALEVDHDI